MSPQKHQNFQDFYDSQLVGKSPKDLEAQLIGREVQNENPFNYQIERLIYTSEKTLRCIIARNLQTRFIREFMDFTWKDINLVESRDNAQSPP